MIRIDSDPNTSDSGLNKNFFEMVNNHEGKELFLTLYNMRLRNIRKVPIVPNKNWINSDSLLGVMLRYENYEIAHEYTYKILSVLKNSPSEKAGLQENIDYVIGLLNFKNEDLNDMINYIVAS